MGNKSLMIENVMSNLVLIFILNTENKICKKILFKLIKYHKGFKIFMFSFEVRCVKSTEYRENPLGTAEVSTP